MAASLFPDLRTRQFKEGWEQLAHALQELLTEDEYASARRTTFNAFYTSPVVMRAAFSGLERLGLPADARQAGGAAGARRRQPRRSDLLRA